MVVEGSATEDMAEPQLSHPDKCSGFDVSDICTQMQGPHRTDLRSPHASSLHEALTWRSTGDFADHHYITCEGDLPWEKVAFGALAIKSKALSQVVRPVTAPYIDSGYVPVDRRKERMACCTVSPQKSQKVYMIPTIRNASQAEGTAPETAECPSVKIEVHEGRRRSPALVGIIQRDQGWKMWGIRGVRGRSN